MYYSVQELNIPISILAGVSMSDKDYVGFLCGHITYLYRHSGGATFLCMEQ